MKGDFSKWSLVANANDAGVLHQQGRVLLDQDWNAAQRIEAAWRDAAGGDIVGDGLVAVPAAAPDSFAMTKATATNAGVDIDLVPGRAWVDGVPLQLSAPVTMHATYLQPPMQDPPFDTTTIDAGVRDAVVLETWEDTVSGFQEPVPLLEPALGGPDTTTRIRRFMALRLLRLDDDQDCGGLPLDDDFGAKGRLTVVPSPTTVVPGPCPVPDSGGYSGFEHALYRIEIAAPKAGVARFKWSQFNGGLVGRGEFTSITATTGMVSVVANRAMIDQSDVPAFYFEALAFDPADGHWRIAMVADATLAASGTLQLTNIEGTWPVPMGSAFFRLWNGIAEIGAFPPGLALPNELHDGIRLEFDAPATGLYAEGDYWTFPARAAGTPFDPSTWPNKSPPEGVHRHRAPLGVLQWQGQVPTSLAQPDIHDCRQPFLPLARMRTCCTFTVGDGKHSFGRFSSIQKAVDALPPSGGTICVLAGVYDESVVVSGRIDVRIHGCGPRTRVRAIVDERRGPLPAFFVVDSNGIALDDMAIESGPRSAVQVHNSAHVSLRRCLVQMRDRDTVWQAVYVRGDDIAIEDNIIEVLSPREGFDERRLPPKTGMPGAPAGVATPPDRIWPGGATRGGIQLAGGCDRVRVARNWIRGGTWNGITLGSLVEVGGRGDDVPDVPPPEDDRCHPCEPPDLGDPGEPGTGRPHWMSAGDLYDIQIVDNRITDMGINGIGVVRFFPLAGGGGLIAVHGLEIADNFIARCLRREPLQTADVAAMRIGYGGIALAHASDLRITGNEIVANGTRHGAPTCGVFALIVQGLHVDGNRIVDNGSRRVRGDEGLATGARGGIHVWLAMPVVMRHAETTIVDEAVMIAATNVDRRAAVHTGATTAQIHDNIVDTPVGRAITLFALGPVSISRNRMVVRGSTYERLDLLATTVLVGDVGASNEWTLGLLWVLILLLVGRGRFSEGERLCMYARLLGLGDFSSSRTFALAPPIVRGWASGKLLLSGNQVTLDVPDDPLAVALTSVLAASLDDVGMLGNQMEVTSTSVFVFFANAVVGGSVRVADNRFSETWMRAGFSGASTGLMNITTDNEATHCLRADAFLPNMLVFRDNLSFIEAFCPRACARRG
jgi:hypothetical protein